MVPRMHRENCDWCEAWRKCARKRRRLFGYGIVAEALWKWMDRASAKHEGIVSHVARAQEDVELSENCDQRVGQVG